MSAETLIKAFVAVVGLAGLLVGVFQFVRVQAVEARTPYLERKLAWCEEAVETTSRIAVAADPAPADQERFWQMYWGVMGLIEKHSITTAMIDFGKALRSSGAEKAPTGSGESAAPLSALSLALAHACRRELSAEWSPSWALSPAGSGG
ncbi:hypothetical protein [Oceaniglobus roseus]|uniref:hypothetical protein n=1 Tax=Oceaniglobus roseus TaxID=1737570 RepID=UPI00130014A0|nr:hypothetical protein [Kandeliimicrobium roseum]